MGIDREDRAVFLDRDGVINAAVVCDGKPYPPATAEALEILPGVVLALQRLRDAGYLLVVVTNQPDVARGTQSQDVVDSIHARLKRQLPIGEFRVCPHDDVDGCVCRKPKPGMLQAVAAERGIDLALSFMVGDRWRDIEAGRSAGCSTIFIDYAYAERRPEAPNAIVTSLPEAVDWILDHPREVL